MRQLNARFEADDEGAYAVVEARDRVDNRSELRFALRDE